MCIRDSYKAVYNKDLGRHSSATLMANSRRVDKRHLNEGDMVFFNINNRCCGIASHVGVYLKDDLFLHATTKQGVIISSLNEPYYRRTYIDVYKRQATTIVENGIDVPNANTIIINDAHRFGLSDLHQLRGRVGRGDKKAYCLSLIHISMVWLVTSMLILRHTATKQLFIFLIFLRSTPVTKNLLPSR